MDVVQALSYALEPEVAGGRPRDRSRVKARSVVFYRKRDRAVVGFAGNLDLGRLAVADGVYDELADDAQYGVGRRL